MATTFWNDFYVHWNALFIKMPKWFYVIIVYDESDFWKMRESISMAPIHLNHPHWKQIDPSIRMKMYRDKGQKNEKESEWERKR